MKPLLMIIDDEDMIRKSLTVYFEDVGWEVVSFRTSEEALAYLSSGKPDYAIVDLRLPGMTGLEFIRKCKKILPLIICVIYTGSIENGTAEDLMELGLREDQIILKPAASLGILRDALTGSNEPPRRNREC